MRRRLFNSALLVCLAAASVAAQAPQEYPRVWLRVAPQGEEFAVHFPEPNYRIRREVPFGGGVMLKPASFEVTQRGAYLSVLSFAKSQAGTPKSLDEFVKGFQHALGESTAGQRASLEFESNVKLDGRDGRQFRLSVEEGTGAVRVYETEQSFYVVLTFSDEAGKSLAEHFQNSFTLDPTAADRVPLSEQADVLRTPVKSPAPLWRVAGGGVPVVGSINSQPTDYSRLPVLKQGERKVVVSGGILNGKAVAKPLPTYPPIAKAARAQGTVTVQILVDEEGYVISANPVSGHPLLQQSAAFAARQARFTPTTLEGQPVKVSGVITFNYVLQ